MTARHTDDRPHLDTPSSPATCIQSAKSPFPSMQYLPVVIIPSEQSQPQNTMGGGAAVVTKGQPVQENYEVANGGFGKAVEDKSVEDGEADERTESEDVNTIPNEFIGFENPDCPELLEWVEKKKELFNEESWKDGGVAEDSTERSPSHGSDSGDDEMGERELSPITGVITEGVGKNEDTHTVNKLVDDTVELSAEKQSKTKADAVRNLNDDLKEAIQQEVADKKGKRPVKIPKNMHSPFMQRIVKLDERIMPDELSVCNAIFASQRDYGTKYMATLMRSSLNIHRDVLVKDGEAFGKLDMLQKTKLLQESEEAAKRNEREKECENEWLKQ
ncbi:hypothetical protein L2E82_02506 [Cichorium intybus]|uniref:Uncharacterized protein n=1 Tax=Cichorium intybus TaxID=13427 RepID=A0ACB9H2N2_CICIN|nr:hypothetical protein L2E82_02506 [Cichorium intybus]